MGSIAEPSTAAGFRERLRATLTEAGCSMALHEFTRDFNLRAGAEAITVQAAAKWLKGESVPNQARLVILAKWLGVSPSWLRYGETADSDQMPPHPLRCLEPFERMLLYDINHLSGRDRRVVRELVDSMLRAKDE